MRQKCHTNDILRRDYQRFYDDKVYGVFMMGKPDLVVKDVDIVRWALDHFTDAQS